MKLGCMFKSVAIIIVLLGTSFYLYNKYGRDLIEQGSEKAKEMAIEKIEKMVDDIGSKEMPAKVEEKYQELIEELDKRKSRFSADDFDNILSKLNKMMEENNFDKKTFDDLEKMILEKGEKIKKSLEK